MSSTKIVSYTMAFVLELGLLAAAGLWGWHVAAGPVWAFVAMLAAIGVTIGIWALWAAPKAAMRLGMPGILILKLALFALGSAALWASGQPGWAALFAALCALHLGLAVLTGTV